MPMQASCVKNDHGGGVGQNTDETLNLCFPSLPLAVCVSE